jgi:hypothetical protein
MNDVYIIESWFGERRNLRQVYAADADDALQTHALHYRGEHVVSVRPRRTAPTASRRGFERTHRRAQRFGLSPFARARALVAAAGGGTAAGGDADADAAATVRQCWGDLLESIASEQY